MGFNHQKYGDMTAQLTKVIKTFRTAVQCLELCQCEISNILPDVWEVRIVFRLSQKM